MPRMFLVVDDEDAGEQLDLVIEKLEGDGAGEESRVHENAGSERERVGHRPRLAEEQGGSVVGGSGLLEEVDLNIGDRKPGLMNYNRRDSASGGGESYFPRPFAGAPVLDGPINEGVTHQCHHERENEMLSFPLHA